MVSQAVGFLIAMAGNVGDGEFETTRQLAAGPVERIKPRAAADVLAGHLLYHQLRVTKHTQRSSFGLCSILQGFQKSCIFSHVVVLMADPFGDVDTLTARLYNHNPNA